MAKKRKAVSKKSRFDVFKRDRFTCQYCGRTPPTVILELDHITPVASDGGNENLNLITSCFDCNRGKGDRHLDQVAPPLASRIAEEQERREQVQQFNEFLLQRRNDEIKAVREIAIYWCDKATDAQPGKLMANEARQASLRRFLQNLTQVELLDAIDIARGKRPWTLKNDDYSWRYFCGICWKIIKERDPK